MDFKQCSKCGKDKPAVEFSPGRRQCHSCIVEYRTEYDRRRYATDPETFKQRRKVNYGARPEQYKTARRAYLRTPKGWAVQRWHAINGRTVNGTRPYWHHKQILHYLNKGIRVEMAQQEFEDWVIANWQTALDVWAAGEKPSIDRIDPAKHYSLDNLRIISLSENIGRANRKGGG